MKIEKMRKLRNFGEKSGLVINDDTKSLFDSSNDTDSDLRSVKNQAIGILNKEFYRPEFEKSDSNNSENGIKEAK